MEALNVARARLARDILLRADAMHLAAWQDVMVEELPAMAEGSPTRAIISDAKYARDALYFAAGSLPLQTLRMRGYATASPDAMRLAILYTLRAQELGSRDKLRKLARDSAEHTSQSIIFDLAADRHNSAAERLTWLMHGAQGEPPAL